MEINDFRGELTDNSAEKEALIKCEALVIQNYCTSYGADWSSEAVLAEISLRSPRKLVIFIIKK